MFYLWRIYDLDVTAGDTEELTPLVATDVDNARREALELIRRHIYVCADGATVVELAGARVLEVVQQVELDLVAQATAVAAEH